MDEDDKVVGRFACSATQLGACVDAINAFRGEHGGVPLVVCARSRDYQELAAQLILKGAVEAQPP